MLVRSQPEKVVQTLPKRPLWLRGNKSSTDVTHGAIAAVKAGEAYF